MLTNNNTNQPEVIGRMRFYPWKKKKDSLLQGFAFGGSIGRGRSRGLSGEQSFAATLPDAAYNFFPQFAINGPIERYNGELTWTHGPWAVRTEYDQLIQLSLIHIWETNLQPVLMNAVLTQPNPAAEAALAEQAQSPAPKKETPLAAGWSGEHFFIRSGDGKFQLQPYGYFMSDYRAYHGDGAPSDTFLISRCLLYTSRCV